MAEPREATGIPEVDEILHGGLISRRSYLLVGGAGSGKTVFSVRWLLEGRRRASRSKSFGGPTLSRACIRCGLRARDYVFESPTDF